MGTADEQAEWEIPTRMSLYSIPELLTWISSEDEEEAHSGFSGGWLAETILALGVCRDYHIFDLAEEELSLKLAICRGSLF